MCLVLLSALHTLCHLFLKIRLNDYPQFADQKSVVNWISAGIWTQVCWCKNPALKFLTRLLQRDVCNPGAWYSSRHILWQVKRPSSSPNSATDQGTVVGWMVTPQRCVHVLILITCEYYLIWLKNEYYIAKDVISNFERRRLSWFIQMGPTCHHKCPYKKKIKGDNTDGRWEHREPHRGEGNVKTEQRVAATSQGMLTATGSWKKQGRILPQSLQRKCSPANTLILDFWPPEYILLVKPLSLWYSLKLPQETNTETSDTWVTPPWN